MLTTSRVLQALILSALLAMAAGCAKAKAPAPEPAQQSGQDSIEDRTVPGPGEFVVVDVFFASADATELHMPGPGQGAPQWCQGSLSIYDSPRGRQHAMAVDCHYVDHHREMLRGEGAVRFDGPRARFFDEANRLMWDADFETLDDGQGLMLTDPLAAPGEISAVIMRREGDGAPANPSEPPVVEPDQVHVLRTFHVSHAVISHNGQGHIQDGGEPGQTLKDESCQGRFEVNFHNGNFGFEFLMACRVEQEVYDYKWAGPLKEEDEGRRVLLNDASTGRILTFKSSHDEDGEAELQSVALEFEDGDVMALKLVPVAR